MYLCTMGNQLPHVSFISNLSIQSREEQIRVWVWECFRSGNKHWFPKHLQDSRPGMKVHLKHHQSWWADLCGLILLSRKFGVSSQHSYGRPIEEPLTGLGCNLCSWADAALQHPHHPQVFSWCFSHVREQQLPREGRKTALSTIIDCGTSSKWQLKQYFSDRSKTSDILSPWITSKKLNFGDRQVRNWTIEE